MEWALLLDLVTVLEEQVWQQQLDYHLDLLIPKCQNGQIKVAASILIGVENELFTKRQGSWQYISIERRKLTILQSIF